MTNHNLNSLNLFLKHNHLDQLTNNPTLTIKSFEDMKIELGKQNVECEELSIHEINDLPDQQWFFACYVDEQDLKFDLCYRHQNEIQLISRFGVKKHYQFQIYCQKYLGQVLWIKKIHLFEQESLSWKQIRWKPTIILSLFYLVNNGLGIVSGLFLTYISKYVIQQASLNNFWWILLCFCLLFGIKMLMTSFVSFYHKKILQRYFLKYFGQIWAIVFQNPKSFFNDQTNLFVINDYLMSVINFTISGLSDMLIGTLTGIICGVLLILVDYWYCLLGILLGCILLIFNLIERKYNQEVFNTNFGYHNFQKNLINLLYYFKNSYYHHQFYSHKQSLFSSAGIQNFEFNLNYGIKKEMLGLYQSIVTQVFNLLLFVIIVIKNINDLAGISSYFFILAINNNFVSGFQGIFNQIVHFPELKKQSNYLGEIFKLKPKLELHQIKVFEIHQVELVQPQFKHIQIPHNIIINQPLCIIGPSGIGKSHLMWSLCHKNPSFEILINNQKLNNLDSQTYQNQVIYLRNDTGLLSDSFFELIESNAHQDIVAEFFQLTNLQIYDIANNKLSSGQIQMVNLMGLLVHHQKLLLLDEVTSNIDQNLLQFFIQKVFPMIYQQNLTIAISHSPLYIQSFQRVLNLYEFIQEDFTHPALPC